jgi:hypothetical protein
MKKFFYGRAHFTTILHSPNVTHSVVAAADASPEKKVKREKKKVR